jgi:hypothetical protein
MASKNLIIILALLATPIAGLLINTINIQASSTNSPSGTQSVQNETSCVNPRTDELQVICRQIEDQILATTIRIEMQGWHLVGGQQMSLVKGGKSHATIVGGRYLVTHNHYSYSLTTVAPKDGEGYTGISLRTMDGVLILENSPLSAYTIAYDDTETLVLEFVDNEGRGLFEKLGLPSAPAIDWKSVNWQVGMELAHIDWNGENAHVDWVLVEEVITNGQTPHVQVGNYALKGSSGGGAYWNGYHVGNVWAHNLEKDPTTDEVTRQYTMIALNPVTVGGLD